MEENRAALLISPPVYDTQYWERWSLPHGLLKVATYLKQQGYRVRLIDCLAPNDQNQVPMRKQKIVRVGTTEERIPPSWNGIDRLSDEKIRYIFGKNKEELARKFDQGLLPGISSEIEWEVPDEIWITSIMSYWWESTREVIEVCKQYFPQAKIRVGGIYPTLAPDHAAANLGLDNPRILPGAKLDLKDGQQRQRDLIVTGEIPNANDLDLALELYHENGICPPKYTILTTSRGCPRDCEYCAAYILSGRKVRVRDPDLTMQEIRRKFAQGIREFCFYEDNLLMAKANFKEILTRIIEDKELRGQIELHSPEGLEIRLIDVELMKLMREAGFRRVYLPLETMHIDSISRWSRDFYSLQQFEKAVKSCEEAGFGRNTQEINVFVLFGLPGEDLQHVYDTAVYASNRTGSVIPMLFAPVPGTPLFKQFEDYFAERGFDLHHLNGKLLPFLPYNQREMKHRYNLTYEDYYQIEAFMLRINQKVLQSSYRLGSDSRVGRAFRKVYREYQSVRNEATSGTYLATAQEESKTGQFVTEYHGSLPMG